MAAPAKHHPLRDLRVSLAAARERGDDFPVAWARALGTKSWRSAEVGWPGDTEMRHLWRAVIYETEDAWRAAYLGEPAPPGVAAISALATLAADEEGLFGRPEATAPFPPGAFVTTNPGIPGERTRPRLGRRAAA